MSLSRILNTSQKSPSPSGAGFSQEMAIDPALMDIPQAPNGAGAAPEHQQQQSSGPSHHHQQPPPTQHPQDGTPQAFYYPPPPGYAHPEWPPPPWSDPYAASAWPGPPPGPDENGARMQQGFVPGRDGLYYQPQGAPAPGATPDALSTPEAKKRKRGEQSLEKRVGPYSTPHRCQTLT